ncbi:hypothetical protein LTR08_001047 [Meristemomyces frigidus]|nr:hypothetical protein LTR08_001047 [Meristemomyces frigidus]
MASRSPDPRALNSREDGLQHPPPAVRKLEQQLRRNLDDNRQKLRDLVGASYRDLLGTAEKIIEMDEQMQAAEGHLGDIGRTCNARAVERIGGNYAGMRKTLDAMKGERHGVVAQTKVLQTTLSVASRTIKAGGDALLVSKLLVLARLLHKNVSESADSPAILEDLRRKLASLRRKLLSYIERALVKSDVERTALANTLCAYSLVSSSSPKDVLRHFLHARIEQLETLSEEPSEAAVVRMLNLYKQTLLDARALFPRLFAEALSQLSNVPLLQDKQLSSLYELNLDIYGIWISEDVRSFTPWIRHEQLHVSDVIEGLTAWVKRAQAGVLEAVDGCIRNEKDATLVLAVRKKVLSQYLNLNINFLDNIHGQGVKDLRKTFQTRLGELAARTALSGMSSLDILQQSSQPSTHPNVSSIWDLAVGDLGTDDGAARLRQEVIDRRSGRDSTVLACVNRLDAWMRELESFWDLTQQMRSTKWDIDLDIDFEDISEGESLEDDLSKADPALMQGRFREATTEALRGLYSSVEKSAMGKEHAATLIRLLREIDQRRASIAEHFGVAEAGVSSSAMVTTLQRHIAETVSEAPLQQFSISTKKRRYTAAALFDGSPALPVQPSPVVFQFLLSLHKAMSDAGNDLWSTGAVEAMKMLMGHRLADVPGSLTSQTRKVPSLTNGHSPAGEDTSNGVEEAKGRKALKDEASSNTLLQLMFDASYLQRIMAITPASMDDQSLQKLVSSVREQLDLDSSSSERIRKSANEYWRRTYLLFGLLAPGSC